MYRRGIRDAQFRWYAVALLAATPLRLLAFTSSSPWLFLAFVGLFLTVLSPFIACANAALNLVTPGRSEEHTSELQSLMRISSAAVCLKKQTSDTSSIRQRLTAPMSVIFYN